MTGTGSGLGRYLHESIPGSVALRRQDNLQAISKGKVFDAIFHCAFRRCQDVHNSDLAQVMEDNCFLTEQLLQVPHKKFIYLSSNTVYPIDKNFNCTEDASIPIEKISTFPAVLKMINEELIRSRSQDYLILRATSLLGHSMKTNTLTRILFENYPKVSLTADSRLYCILYEDVKFVLMQALKKNITGVFNLAASKSVELSEVASLFGKKVIFGNYHYEPGKIDNRKLIKQFPELDKTSWQNIEMFYRNETRKVG